MCFISLEFIRYYIIIFSFFNEITWIRNLMKLGESVVTNVRECVI